MEAKIWRREEKYRGTLDTWYNWRKIMTKKRYIIRGYRDGDEGEINTLFNEIFGSDGRLRTLEEWHWKFKRNPVRVEDISDYATLAECDGKIAGQYAIWFGNFKYKDKIIKTSHAVDNIMHPDYRNFRVQLDMFKKQNEVASKEDVKFGFGFPNEVAYSVGKTLLEYKDIGELTTLSMRLNLTFPIKRRMPFLPDSIIGILQRLSTCVFKGRMKFTQSQSNLIVQEINTFDAAFDEFWKKISLCYPLMVKKDSTYMNWRYKEKPGDQYRAYVARDGNQIKGCVVLKAADDFMYYPGAIVGYIMELLSLKENGIPEALLRTALNHFVSQNADFSVAVIFKEDFLYNSLIAMGFVPRQSLMTHRMVYTIFDRAKIDEDFIKNQANWHVMLGDFDTL